MGNRGQRTRIAPGIYTDHYGLSSTVKVGTVQRERRFTEGTKLLTIRGWQDEVRAQLRKLPAEQSGTLQADVARYLVAVEPTLASFADRKRHVEAWLPRFGHYRMDVLLSSTTPALNAQLRAWRRTLSASSCNQRRETPSPIWSRCSTDAERRSTWSTSCGSTGLIPCGGGCRGSTSRRCWPR